MAKKLFIKTHGCQMNEYDSSRMADLLGESHQLELTDNEKEADVILLNTCSIREKAQDKVYHQLGRWKKLKDANPDLVIGVGGCVASQEGEALRKRAPFVDMIFGPQTLHRVPKMLDARANNQIAAVDVTFPEIEKFDHLPQPKSDGATAFVSIMEGCSKYCTFCVVPYTRGEEVSRPFEAVMDEVIHLADQGVREINLLGQNVNAYRGDNEDGDEIDLAELIACIAAVDGIDRIRFTTSHPVEFTDSLVDAYADIPELVSHLHLPVQSGSDRILSAMKRGHTAEEYIEKMERIRANRPDISFSSDFIVGFPGETDQDFEDTLSLVGEVGYAQAYSFKYSPRPGTPAAGETVQVEEAVKAERLARLQDKLNIDQAAFNKSCEGRTMSVLLDRRGKKDGQLVGRSPYLQSVHVDAPDAAFGHFAEVTIDKGFANSLSATLISTHRDQGANQT